MSLFLFSTIFLNGSPAVPVDPRRLALELSSADWFRWVTRYGYAVAAGCAMEVWEVSITIKDWWLLKFQKKEVEEDKKSWSTPLAAVGLIVIVAGIVLETYCEGKAANAETELRNHFSEQLSVEEDAASKATTDAGNARKETAQLQKDTERLKTEAADARRDMAAAQLALAKLTGPIQSVPVIDGTARPDPMKGTRQRVLLRSDTVIIFPTLPKGVSVDWNLFITQDNVGQHQFGTIPKFMPGGDPNSPFGNMLMILYPLSTCTMDLTSDEHGTIDRGFQGANCIIPTANK